LPQTCGVLRATVAGLRPGEKRMIPRIRGEHRSHLL